METNKLLMIVLILVIFMVFINHIVIITPTKNTNTTQVVPVPIRVNRIGGCSGTRYGCCPNGVTPKSNYIGSNC
jgi:hypothetical protein